MVITIELDDGCPGAPIDEKELVTATVYFSGVLEAGYNKSVCIELAETLKNITENYLDLAQKFGPIEEEEESDEESDEADEESDEADESN